MFKNIYFRLVATYLTLFLAIVIVISFFSTSLFYKEFTRQIEENLRNAAEKTNNLMERYYSNKITRSELSAWIDAMAYISNIKIYILNPDSSILGQVSENENLTINEQLKADIITAMDGQEVIRMSSITVGPGLEEVVYVTEPLKYDGKVSRSHNDFFAFYRG